MSKLFTLLMSVITKLNSKATLVDGKVPKEQLPDDIGGGVTSWNELEDKPFYESGTVIEWDGNTAGLETFNLAEIFDFYKASSDTPTKEELTGATAMAYFDDSTIEGEIGADITFVDTDNGNFAGFFDDSFPLFFVVSTIGADSAMEIDFNPTATGIYFFKGPYEGEHVHYIRKDYSIKQIDSKFIPVKEVDLSNYYTKSEIDNGHYTKSEIDNGHYTKSEIDNGYYTKSEIDGKHQTIIDLIGNCGEVIGSINTLIGGDSV